MLPIRFTVGTSGTIIMNLRLCRSPDRAYDLAGGFIIYGNNHWRPIGQIPYSARMLPIRFTVGTSGTIIRNAPKRSPIGQLLFLVWTLNNTQHDRFTNKKPPIRRLKLCLFWQVLSKSFLPYLPKAIWNRCCHPLLTYGCSSARMASGCPSRKTLCL